MGRATSAVLSTPWSATTGSSSPIYSWRTGARKPTRRPIQTIPPLPASTAATRPVAKRPRRNPFPTSRKPSHLLPPTRARLTKTMQRAWAAARRAMQARPTKSQPRPTRVSRCHPRARSLHRAMPQPHRRTAGTPFAKSCSSAPEPRGRTPRAFPRQRPPRALCDPRADWQN